MADLGETIEPDFIQTRGALRAKKLKDEAAQFRKDVERRNPSPQPKPIENERLEPGGTLGREAPDSLGFAVTKDLMKGLLMEPPRAIIGGARGSRNA